MDLGNVWSRALVYFGIVEEEDYWDDDAYEAEQDLERSYRERPNVRRLNPRPATQSFDDWTDEKEAGGQASALGASAPSKRRLEAVEAASGSVQVHLVVPKSFNDAQSIADRFKDSVPVILNLQATNPDLSKRLMDFSSGLTYALNGGIQRVTDKVFLLTPQNVEVSEEERARLVEREFSTRISPSARETVSNRER